MFFFSELNITWLSTIKRLVFNDFLAEVIFAWLADINKHTILLYANKAYYLYIGAPFRHLASDGVVTPRGAKLSGINLWPHEWNVTPLFFSKYPAYQGFLVVLWKAKCSLRKTLTLNNRRNHALAANT